MVTVVRILFETKSTTKKKPSITTMFALCPQSRVSYSLARRLAYATVLFIGICLVLLQHASLVAGQTCVSQYNVLYKEWKTTGTFNVTSTSFVPIAGPFMNYTLFVVVLDQSLFSIVELTHDLFLNSALKCKRRCKAQRNFSCFYSRHYEKHGLLQLAI